MGTGTYLNPCFLPSCTHGNHEFLLLLYAHTPHLNSRLCDFVSIYSPPVTADLPPSNLAQIFFEHLHHQFLWTYSDSGYLGCCHLTTNKFSEVPHRWVLYSCNSQNQWSRSTDGCVIAYPFILAAILTVEIRNCGVGMCSWSWLVNHWLVDQVFQRQQKQFPSVNSLFLEINKLKVHSCCGG